MATYGKKMVQAALRKSKRLMEMKAVPPVTSQEKVNDWLNKMNDNAMSACPDVENDQESIHEDEESDYIPETEEESDSLGSEVHSPNCASGPDNSTEPRRKEFSRESTYSSRVIETEVSSDTPSPSRAQIRKAFQNVTVAGDPKVGNKRNYRKPDYCLFCKSLYNSKISAHYLSVHAMEKQVREIVALPCGSKERKRLLALLQHEGNHEHNIDVLRNGCGEITVSRRPADKDASKAELYVPCTECKAWVFERSLSVHAISCPAGKSPDKNLLRNSRMLIS